MSIFETEETRAHSTLQNNDRDEEIVLEAAFMEDYADFDNDGGAFTLFEAEAENGMDPATWITVAEEDMVELEARR